MASPEPPRSSKVDRLIVSCALVALAGIAVAVRYVLFEEGVLYGEAAARMASFTVSGFIIAAGCLAVWIVRGRSGRPDQGGGQQESKGSRDSPIVTVAAILGLALTGYSVSELVAPNTPVAASVPACSGVPVYGAKYFAVTALNGVNARRGPGPEYQQLARYPAGCTLGFDGYCIGFPEPDYVVGTPDQRWLLVHDRSQLVSAAYVLSESAESRLGANPNPECGKLGGFPQPRAITMFTYNNKTGQLGASAPGAALVGYGVVPLDARSPLYSGTHGTYLSPTFAAQLPPSNLVDDLQGGNGQLLVGAAICLAENVPVVSSIRAEIITIHNSRIIHAKPETHIPSSAADQLAEFACNNPR